MAAAAASEYTTGRMRDITRCLDNLLASEFVFGVGRDIGNAIVLAITKSREDLDDVFELARTEQALCEKTRRLAFDIDTAINGLPRDSPERWEDSVGRVIDDFEKILEEWNDLIEKLPEAEHCPCPQGYGIGLYLRDCGASVESMKKKRARGS
jgi:hypothetical protein